MANRRVSISPSKPGIVSSLERFFTKSTTSVPPSSSVSTATLVNKKPLLKSKVYPSSFSTTTLDSSTHTTTTIGYSSPDNNYRTGGKTKGGKTVRVQKDDDFKDDHRSGGDLHVPSSTHNAIRRNELQNNLRPRRKTEGRTYRIWHPQSDKKSILVNVGAEIDHNEVAAKVFAYNNMRKKNFNEWRKDARAQLPSITGGVPLESLEDVVEVGPTVKSDNIATAQERVRRLSLELAQNRKSIGGRRWKSLGSQLTPKRSKLVMEISSTTVTIEDESEEERRQAGQDINGKIHTLKELAEHLSNKRVIRQTLITKATGDPILNTEEIPVREQILFLAEYLHQFIHDLVSSGAIWEKHIHQINGRFGVVVASYFIWLRRILGLNMFYFLITLFGILIPQVADDMAHAQHGGNHSHVGRRAFHFTNLIHGEGFFSHSYMYYSGYHSIRAIEMKSVYDNAAFRFLFVIFVIFVFNTYFIFSRMNKYYHSTRMESKVAGVAMMDNFKSIVCAWDFSCNNKEASISLHRTIRRELHMLAVTSQQGKHSIDIEAELTTVLALMEYWFGEYWGPVVMHALSTILIILCCAILGTVLYSLCGVKLQYYLECIPSAELYQQRNTTGGTFCPNRNRDLETWILCLPALFACFTMLLLTRVVILLGEGESWGTAERKVYATMSRAGFMYFTNIAVFFTFWINNKNELEKNGFVFETILGKELYRLIVIEGMLDILLNLGVKGIIHCIRRHQKNYKKPEFRSEYYALNLFYIYSLSIIGVLFCPPITFFVIIRLVLDFYLQRFSLLYLSCHETYSAHASSVYAPYLLTFFICYLLSAFLNVFYLSETRPSQFDGPFIDVKRSYDEVLLIAVSRDKSTRWLKYLAKPGFLYTFIILFGTLVYFCRQWALSYGPIIQQLNALILLEREDRNLLLKAIFDIGKVSEADVPSQATTPASTAVSTTAEESTDQDHYENVMEEKVDAQINRLIKHVQARRSIDFEAVRRKSILWSTAKHHREHMQQMVANIVNDRRKSGESEGKKQGNRRRRFSTVSNTSTNRGSLKDNNNHFRYSAHHRRSKVSKFEQI